MLARHLFLALACFTLFFASSCKRNKIHKKDITDSTGVISSTTPKYLDTLKTNIPETNNSARIAVTPAEIDFKFLNIKSKVNFSSDGAQQTFPVTAHIEKDNKIWLSIVVGLEVARGLITRDSILFVDRLHRTYYKYDFATLSKQFNFNINFDLVQSILIGNMPLKIRESDAIMKEDGGYSIKQKEEFLQLENFIGESNLKLQKLVASDESGSSKMQIDYGNFLSISDLLFPQEIVAKIDAQKDNKTSQTLINLQHNKIEFLNESPGFTFSIPKGYTPK